MFSQRLGLLASAGIIIAITSGGAAYVRLTYFTIDDCGIVTWTSSSSMLATVRGRIVSAPQTSDSAPSLACGYNRGPRTRFTLSADEILTMQGWRQTNGLACVTVSGAAGHLSAGQRVELVAKMGRYHAPKNPGEFDAREWARKNQTQVWMQVPSPDGAIIIDSPQSTVMKILWNLRSSARQKLLISAGSEDGQLVNALITGQRSPSLRKLNKEMIRAGIAHFLSISGMHLGIFLGCVYFLCRIFSARPSRSAIVVLVVLAWYVLIAKPNPPLLRASIMGAVICLSVIMNRKASMLNSLALAGIILLVFDPLRLFGAGFQLSFTIVTGIIILHRPAKRMVFGRWIKRRGLMVFRGKTRFRRWWYFVLADRSMDAVTVSFVCFVVSVPLVGYHFGIFSPYAILANILLAPLVVAVLIPGYVSLGLAWVMPNLSSFFGSLSGEAAGWLTWAVNLLSKLPGLCLEIRPVGVVWVLACYGALILFMLRKRIMLGRTLSVLCISAVVILTVKSQLPVEKPARARLSILSVGAGQCAILQTPSGKTFLFDAGTQSGYDVFNSSLLPFIKNARIESPKSVFVSHANTDHYNAIFGLVGNKSNSLIERVETVYMNEYFGLSEPISAGQNAAGKFLQYLDSNNVNIVRIREGQIIQLDEQTRVEVLWPPSPSGKDAPPETVNDTSLVMRLTCDGVSVLFTGDIEEQAQARLIRIGDIQADILILPHHGSWEPTMPQFVKAVNPKIVLVSQASRANRSNGYPADAEEQFLNSVKTDRKYYSTALNGCIQVDLSKGNIQIKTMREYQP